MRLDARVRGSIDEVVLEGSYVELAGFSARTRSAQARGSG